jgi:hypothetical protein
VPQGVLTQLQLQQVALIAQEDRCQSAAYYITTHRAEAATNMTSFRTTCEAAMRELRFGGHKFGPPSQWEIFQQICRTCSQYSQVLTPTRRNTDCDCHEFRYSKGCVNLSPTDMLCELFQVCMDADTYHDLYCAENVRASSGSVGPCDRVHRVVSLTQALRCTR